MRTLISKTRPGLLADLPCPLPMLTIPQTAFTTAVSGDTCYGLLHVDYDPDLLSDFYMNNPAVGKCRAVTAKGHIYLT